MYNYIIFLYTFLFKNHFARKSVYEKPFILQFIHFADIFIEDNICLVFQVAPFHIIIKYLK